MTASLVRLLALRFVRTRRRGGSPSAVLSLVGVAVGVMTLTVVLGVMNGFQLGFIESIVEISSYHLQAVPTAAAAGPRGGMTMIRFVPIEAICRSIWQPEWNTRQHGAATTAVFILFIL